MRSVLMCLLGFVLGVSIGLMLLRVALAASNAGGTTVNIAGFAFGPKSVTIRPGDTITWTNKDAVSHTATANGGSFNSGTLAPNASYTHTFTQTGVFSYFCNIHPSMLGVVNVVSGTQVSVYLPLTIRAKLAVTGTVN